MKRTITKAQLIRKLRDLTDEADVELVVCVDVRLNKYSNENINPYIKYGIKKWSRVRAVLNVSYEDAVNQARSDEGIRSRFRAEPHPHGEHRRDNCLIYKDGLVHSLQVIITEAQVLKYTYNNRKIDKDKFRAWEPPSRKESARQGTKNPIIVREYLIKNIREITIHDTTYTIA